MKLNVYTMYDVQADVFSRPVFLNNDQEAIRTVEMEVTNEDSALAKNPNDFTFYSIGVFDPATGYIESTPRKKIITALEALRSRKNKLAQIEALHAEIANVQETMQ